LSEPSASEEWARVRLSEIDTYHSRDTKCKYSEEPTPKRFEDTLRILTRQIDLDLGELKENLAASRTVSVLSRLRLLLLKFATGVIDKGKTVIPQISQG
jgi:hypothetical protein